MSDAIKLKKHHLYLAIVAATALALAGCSDDDHDHDDSSAATKPAKPTGLGSEQTVDIPQVDYPLPSVDNAENNADGSLRYTLGQNPIAYLLRGINEIWHGTSETWQNAANGNGPDDYLPDPILDPKIWKENIQYVVDVTQNRTDEQAILAFLDDQRSKNYSVIDGYGPLTEAYVEGSDAYVDIPVPTVDQVLVDANYQSSHNDNIAFAGNTSADLGAVVSLVDLFRQRSPASTSASKYIFSTPRPWRMNDSGEIDFLGTDRHYTCTDSEGTASTVTYDRYTSSVEVVPGLMCSRRAHDAEKEADGLYTAETENRRKDGGYPSGHTNAGYLAAMAYAYALPQRYSAMLTRGSQLGEDRIVAGMHSPVDVIGGRIHALSVASYALNNGGESEAEAASEQAQQYFGDMAGAEGMSLYEFAHQSIDDSDETGLIDGNMINTAVYDNNDYDDHGANKKLYRQRLTYGLSQNKDEAGQDPVVPAGAEALLKSRQPYLSDEQRRAVLATTEIDSGYPILDDSNGWGRLDLVTAADGYGAFDGDVSVTMDASEGGFNAHDWWRNDIDGKGMLTLTQDNSGRLTLTGDNSYSGGILLQGGTLEAASASAFGTGDVYVENGTLRINPADDKALEIGGNLTMENGTLAMSMDEDNSQITVGQQVYIAGGTLKLDFADDGPTAGTKFTLINGATVSGTFGNVDAGDVNVELSYSDSGIAATVQ
ncbi:phosphatase PAP2 family protein [Salinicola corii]|uniref:Phosphatase PAP2 family protein n=1 Tax=Salinicola corii TaxID=2606937 RepID=A0A640WHR9_9GAMM|nr:phosphatase PAP2 family protein [Salinicola corii]KAA0019902.1 phosphatase PAP2 family protein [Salinicola corii]